MGLEARGEHIGIRPYQQKDKQAVRGICIATSGLPVETQRQKELLLLQYCDYYLEQEPEACFVAVDKTDTPVGYILCSKDYQAYQARFRKSYLPLIQARSILRAALARMDLRIAGRYAGQYPAHMHIDILDAYQRMGIGHQLVNTLTASLAGQTTRGLMLSVGSTNKKGVNFYKKYGFQRIGTAAFGSIVVMGLRLS